jgi:Flp pilus assembly protein protease CpaA
MAIRRTLIQQQSCEISMTLELELANYLSFAWMIVVLLSYSESDIKSRSIPNMVTIPGLLFSFLSVLLTGHLLTYLVLHVAALVLTLLLCILLFRIGAIGGADFKVLLTVAVVSPGVEFGRWSEPVFEAIIALGFELLVMLVLGHLYWKRYRSREEQESKPPLIPFLLVGYLLVQLLAIF